MIERQLDNGDKKKKAISGRQSLEEERSLMTLQPYLVSELFSRTTQCNRRGRLRILVMTVAPLQ